MRWSRNGQDIENQLSCHNTHAHVWYQWKVSNQWKKGVTDFQVHCWNETEKTKHVQFNKPAYFTWTWLLCHLRCGERLSLIVVNAAWRYVGGLLIHRTLFLNFQKYTSFNQWLYKATQIERLVSYPLLTSVSHTPESLASPLLQGNCWNNYFTPKTIFDQLNKKNG